MDSRRMYRSSAHGGKNEEILYDSGKIHFEEDEFVDFFADIDVPETQLFQITQNYFGDSESKRSIIKNKLAK